MLLLPAPMQIEKPSPMNSEHSSLTRSEWHHPHHRLGHCQSQKPRRSVYYDKEVASQEEIFECARRSVGIGYRGATEKEKRAKRFEREQEEFRRGEDEMLQTAIASTSLASRFGGNGGGAPPAQASWATAATSTQRTNAFGNGKGRFVPPAPLSGPQFTDTEVADPNVIDWDEHTVVGTSSKLEKPYLRLTSAPDPKTVRPLVTLVQTLELLKKKWRTENNYAYICDQFKSMRQDLTVQRIKNEFTVKVYEIHARIALEMGDLGEYNQCQSHYEVSTHTASRAAPWSFWPTEFSICCIPRTAEVGRTSITRW